MLPADNWWDMMVVSNKKVNAVTPCDSTRFRVIKWQQAPTMPSAEIVRSKKDCYIAGLGEKLITAYIASLPCLTDRTVNFLAVA